MKFSVKEVIDDFNENIKSYFTDGPVYNGYPEIEIIDVPKEDVAKTFIGHGEQHEWEEFAKVTLTVDSEVLYTTMPWSSIIMDNPLEAYYKVGREIVLGMGDSINIGYKERLRILCICDAAIKMHRDVGNEGTDVARLCRFDTDAYRWYRLPIYCDSVPEGYTLTAQSMVVEHDAKIRIRDIPRLTLGANHDDVRVQTEWTFTKNTDKLDQGELLEVVTLTTESKWNVPGGCTQRDIVNEFYKRFNK